MNKTALSIALTLTLVFSLYLNVLLFTQNQTILQPKKDLTQFTGQFGNVQIITDTYGFSPPITMYQAIKTGLESDNWTASGLENMTIRVVLYHGAFENQPISNLPAGHSIEPFKEVTAPVTSYSPVQTENATYRYFWEITVDKTESLGVVHHPPMGLYMVDAQTAEILPHGNLY